MTPTPLELDAAARRRAQLDFERPVVLEAGAGTGKTTALVARLLAWTLGPGWERAAADRETEAATDRSEEAVALTTLEGVVAITFTEAAAAEMAERYQAELARIAAGEGGDGAPAQLPRWLAPEALPADPELRATRARSLLAGIDRLRVQTIHSFALALLRSGALELGLHPSLEVDADESSLESALQEVLTEQLPPRYRAGDPALTLLARDGIGPGEIADAVRELAGCGVEAADLERDPFDAASIAEALAPLAAAATALGEALRSREPPRRLPALVALRDDLGRIEELLGEPVAGAAGLRALGDRLADALSSTAANKLNNLRRGNLAQAEQEIFEDPRDLAARARAFARAFAFVLELDAERLAAARSVVAPVAAEVERRQRARGRVTFADLLRLAVLLLDRPGVAAALRRGIRQMLVDEFQDTDDLQCQLVRRLALEGEPGERPGLFLVGDPKQSIYGWRRARLSVYRRFVDEALGGGRAAPLVANFRSAAGILAEVERVAEPLMPAETETAARFEPLVARGARAGDPATIEYWLVWPLAAERRVAAAEAARREAASIADDLARRIAAGEVEPARVALLLRGKTHLDSYLEALRERGVAFAVEKDRSYFRRRETIDAGALVRATLDPADLVALVTWLRSPFVGVPDAALLPLWRAGLPERLGRAERADEATLAGLGAIVDRALALLPGDVPGLERVAGWPVALRSALEALVERRAAFEEEGAALWVDRLRARFLPEVTAAARWQGPHRLANLDRFFRELTEKLAGSEPVHRLLAELRRSVAEGPDAPEGRPLESADDAVRVMTLHSAKGLEFDEVYLVGLHQPTGARRRAAGQGAERVRGRWEYRLFGLPTPALAPLADLDERIRAAEQVRLLYVGMTRAIRRLVMVGNLPAVGAPDPERAGHLAALLAGRLPAAEEWRARLASAGEAGLADAHGVRWRILPRAAAPEPGRMAREEGERATPFDPEAALARRAAARAAAEARQARPGLARATEVGALEAEIEPQAESDEPWTPPSRPLSDDAREEARARGTALHVALERAPLAAEAPESWRAAARATFERELAGGASGAALARLEARLDRLAGSRLLARLAELEPRIAGRELPLLLAAGAAAAEGGALAEPAPIAGVTGAIDLLYRDPETGEPVIADFKSDAVDEAGIGRLVDRYRPQLDLYARAALRALGLESPPRRELWLLELDRIVVL